MIIYVLSAACLSSEVDLGGVTCGTPSGRPSVKINQAKGVPFRRNEVITDKYVTKGELMIKQ